MSETVVITGGRGFVGTYLADELRQAWQGVEIESWDLPQVDITEPEQYRQKLKQLQPRWLVHLAAISSVPAATRDPALTHRVNVEATQNILQTIEEVTPGTHVFVTSTADIYGSTAMTANGSPLSELPLEQARPQNPYAESKWEMEKTIRDLFVKRTLRVRPFPHIGPGQGLGFVTADFASQIAAIERGLQEPIMKVGNLEAKRDFTDVRDTVRAYRLLMEQGQLGEVYHVASGVATSIKEMLDMLLSFSRMDIQIERDPDRMRAHDIPVLVGDATRLKEATGWEPKIPLAQSLREILDWWREH